MQSRLTGLIHRHSGTLLALPTLFWLVVFFLVPLVIIAAVSFLTRTSTGVGTTPLTLAAYERAFRLFGNVIFRSVWTAFLTTIICLLVGYPLAFFIRTRSTVFRERLALFLIMLPFWTNFLVRTYAWQVLLSRNGVVNGFLMTNGFIAEPIQFLNTLFALLLGLTYGYLPYMVLPLYAALRRFDFKLMEAAQDLGANDWKTFWHVLFPSTLPSVIIGCVLVFIPAIGDFVVSDLMGGSEGLMIGKLVENQYQGVGNMPLGAALSVIMMLPIVITLVIYARMSRREEINLL